MRSDTLAALGGVALLAWLLLRNPPRPGAGPAPLVLSGSGGGAGPGSSGNATITRNIRQTVSAPPPTNNNNLLNQLLQALGRLGKGGGGGGLGGRPQSSGTPLTKAPVTDVPSQHSFGASNEYNPAIEESLNTLPPDTSSSSSAPSSGGFDSSFQGYDTGGTAPVDASNEAAPTLDNLNTETGSAPGPDFSGGGYQDNSGGFDSSMGDQGAFGGWGDYGTGDSLSAAIENSISSGGDVSNYGGGGSDLSGDYSD